MASKGLVSNSASRSRDASPLGHGAAHGGGNSSAVAQRVYSLLLSQIINLERKPFDEVSEAQLAEQFGVSRSPVREALARLAKLHMVDIFPQRGTVIAPIRIRLLANAQFLRESLELGLLRRAIKAPGREKLEKQLEAELAVQQAMIAIGDNARFAASDEAFHHRIATAAGLPDISDHIADVRLHIDRVGQLLLTSTVTLPEVLAQHTEILNAIKTGDPAIAEDALRLHLRRLFSQLPEAHARHPEYFDRAEYDLGGAHWLNEE
ncbi:MAG: GntR family transcriptional regulator [Novosphingobium sp.]|nr:GntR family transcriptional regulator [Novosphingobium sp.]